MDKWRADNSVKTDKICPLKTHKPLIRDVHVYATFE